MSDPRDQSLSAEELRNKVIYGHHRGESERRIAVQLGVSRWKVTKILRLYHKSRGVQEQSNTLPPESNSSEAIPQSLGRPLEKRASKLDAFEPQLQQFLDGLLAKTRYSKHHAQKVLTLLNVYPKSDVLAAMQRAVTYRAFGYSSLERILAHQGTPKPAWQQLSQSEQEAIAKLTDSKPIPPRHSQEYQDLLYGQRDSGQRDTSSEITSESQQHEPQESSEKYRSSGDDSGEPEDAQDQDASGGT